MQQDLSTRRDWPVKKVIVNLPIRLKGNSYRTSGNFLSLFGAKNKDIGAASQTLLDLVLGLVLDAGKKTSTYGEITLDSSLPLLAS